MQFEGPIPAMQAAPSFVVAATEPRNQGLFRMCIFLFMFLYLISPSLMDIYVLQATEPSVEVRPSTPTAPTALDKWEKTSKVAESWAKIAALIIGGIWAYYQFFNGRTFRSRLDINVSVKTFIDVEMIYLIVAVQLKNIGLSKIDIIRRGTAVRVFSNTIKTENTPKALRPNWSHVISSRVFERHSWIEPGETIGEQLVFSVPNQTVEKTAYNIELRVIVPKTNSRMKKRIRSFVGKPIKNITARGNVIIRPALAAREETALERVRP